MEMYNEQFFNESMKKLSDWQTQTYEPARKMGESSAMTFEKYAKLGYETAGDIVDFYVEQAHMAANTTDIKAYFENQQTVFSQLNSTMSARASEYVDLTADIQHEAKEVVSGVIKQLKKTPAKTSTKSTAKKES